MKTKNVSGWIIILFLFLFSGCLSQRTEVPQTVSYVKAVKVEGNEITLEMERNSKELYRSYELYLDGSFVREDKIYGTTLKISAMEDGNYDVVVKVKMENGALYKSNPYNFSIQPSDTEKMKVDSIEGIKDVSGNVAFNIYATNRETYEVYLKDLSIKFFDENGRDISTNFQQIRDFSPIMVKSQESKKIGIAYKNLVDLDKVYVEASINGYTEKDRKLVTLASKKTMARMLKQSEISISVATNKNIYVDGENIKLSFNVSGVKQGNIRFRYGNNDITKSFYENQKYDIELTAQTTQTSIKAELVDEEITKEISINTIKPEDVRVDSILESRILINKVFALKVTWAANIAEELISVELPTDVTCISESNGNYSLQTSSTSEQSIKIYVIAGKNKSLVKEVKVKAERDEYIKVDRIKHEENGTNVKISCVLKVVSKNLYRFREIRGDVELMISENKSTDYELISQSTVKDIVIDFSLEKKTNVGMKNLYLIYEEIETGELVKVEIF